MEKINSRQYGDWVDVPLAGYSEEVEQEVRKTQQEQIDLAIESLGNKPYAVEWIRPKVVLAWKITVEDEREDGSGAVTASDRRGQR